MRYEPYVNPPWVGLKCIAKDGSVSYVYLNPSDNPDESDSDVFVYNGNTGDPVSDHAECFIVPANTPRKGNE